MQVDLIKQQDQQTIEEQFRFKKNQTAQKNTWHVWVTLELLSGQVQSHISLQEQQNPDPSSSAGQTQSVITCLLWCQDEKMNQTIEDNTTLLTEALMNLGADSVQVHLSDQPFPPPTGDSKIEKISLIDIKI